MLVTLEAPDQVGLLWAVADWFESQGCTIEVCRASSSADMARDTFVVVGECDCSGLSAALGGVAEHEWHLPGPVGAGLRLGVTAAAVGVGAAVAVRSRRSARPAPAATN